MHHTIVLGYDGSACSEAALEEALGLAHGLFDGEVLVVYCREPPAGLSCDLDPSCEAARELRKWEQRVRQETGPMLRRAAARIRDAGVRSEMLVMCGDPVEVLPRVAVDRGAQVIVVGSHREGLLAAALRRCTPLELLRHSCVPVLVVPFKKPGRARSGAEQGIDATAGRAHERS